MSSEERAKLDREYERLRSLARELNVQVNFVGQVLGALPVNPPELRANACNSPDELAVIVKAIIPTLREAVRVELKSLAPLDEAWYEPNEVAAMSCGRIKAETVRDWLRWGQIDGESDGRQIRIYQSTVVALRENKWHPLRQPDPSKLPPSKIHRKSSKPS
jgi:hypothetical protein